MLVRTFEGTDMSSIIKKIKKDFGKQAVVLGTEKAFSEDANQTIFRVKAAVPETQLSSFGATKHDVSAQGAKPEIVTSLQKSHALMKSLQEQMPNQQVMRNIERELLEIKALLYGDRYQDKSDTPQGLPDPLIEIVKHLRLMSLDPIYIDQLIKFLEKEYQSNKKPDLRSSAVKWMLKRIKISQNIGVKGCPEVHFFVGAPGSGKTTCVAKIAAHLEKEDRSRVKIVSLNNLNVGSFEQLKIYSKVIGVPLHSASTLEDYNSILANNQDQDITLVDTSGCCSKDIGYLDCLKTIITSSETDTRTHLVLSLTEKQMHLDQSIRTFSSLGLQNLLFTKLDQTWTYGEIYNLTTRWSIPLSFFSTGQEVPTNLERASRERVVERIFRI